jgi:ketosteroid isomerase-like protein
MQLLPRYVDCMTMMRAFAVVLLAACATQRGLSRPSSPEAAAEELFAADRAFGEAGAKTDVVSALAAMFDHMITMPVPGGRFVEGKDAAVQSLRSNAMNARSRVSWTPVRVGISADGQHGFTLGYMTLQMPDSAPVPLKYLSYWVKRRDGWRVAVYRRRRHAQPPPSGDVMAPALPPRLVTPTTNASVIAMYEASLDREERAFSDSAQVIGLGRAFEMFGSADAINLGDDQAPTFIVGSRAIGQAIGGSSPSPGSPVTWAPDRVLVASSGDLGVTIGHLRPNAPATAAAIPFFTIWRRASPGDRWLYVAE